MSKTEKTTDPKWAAQVTEDMKAAVLARAADGKVTWSK